MDTVTRMDRACHHETTSGVGKNTSSRVIPLGDVFMSIGIDLILFEPSRNVLYGMPVFIGTDARLLHSLLRGHGESWDNPCMWLAGYFDDPARFVLRCKFNSSSGKRYAKRLIPHLGSGLHVEFVAQAAEACEAALTNGCVSISLTQAWFLYRYAMPQRVAAAHPGQLARQHGYWFPCDGAVALNVSGLGTVSPMQVEALVEQLMAQPIFIEALRARAECCFLFRLAHLSAQANPPFAWLDICWRRETPLQGRRGRLIEADLLVAADIAPTERPSHE
jgi:hypothetical protein